MTVGPRDEAGGGATIVATPEAEGEAETASIEDAVASCVSSEKLDARIAFGGKGNKVNLAAGFARGVEGTTTPASAARRTAAVGPNVADAAADGKSTAPAACGPLKTASCEAIACCKATAPGVATAPAVATATGAAAPPGLDVALDAAAATTTAALLDAVGLLDAVTLLAVVAATAAALRDVVESLEEVGDEAVRIAPIPAPVPNTSRPPAAIVTNPLPASALGAAMSSVPPLTVVPPVYVFDPLRVSSPLPESLVSTNAMLPLMFPANVVAEPADEATVSVGAPHCGSLFVTIAPAEPTRLPTVCEFPAKSSTPLEAIVRAVAVGRFMRLVSPTPPSTNVPPENRRRTVVGVGAIEGQRATARHYELPAAANHAAIAQRVALIELHRGAVAQRDAPRTAQGLAASAIANLERAAVDARGAAVGVVAGED